MWRKFGKTSQVRYFAKVRTMGVAHMRVDGQADATPCARTQKPAVAI